MDHDKSKPLIFFYQFYPDGPVPSLPDPAPFGAMPLRAMRYCEPFLAAARFGWFIYPPFDFSILWDGKNCYWRREGLNESMEFTRFDSVILPEVSEYFRENCPSELDYCSNIAFLGKAPDFDILQIWTGLMVKTQPGWGVLVRPPANLPTDPNFEVFDGIIETDWWFGPLVTPIRLRRQNVPMIFSKNTPLAHIQLIQKEVYLDETIAEFLVIKNLTEMESEQWHEYAEAFDRRNESPKKLGTYRNEALLKRRLSRDENKSHN
jgi:Family of unknown function (DUF6065)